MQKVSVLLIDDLDGGEADETVAFALGPDDYEIDLNGDHAAMLREALAPFVAAGRQIRQTPAKRKGTAPGVGRPRNKVERGAYLIAVRQWAKQTGKQINNRGRVPTAIIAEYETAHGGAAAAAVQAPEPPAEPAAPPAAVQDTPAPEPVPVAAFTPVKEPAPRKPRKPRKPKDPS